VASHDAAISPDQVVFNAELDAAVVSVARLPRWEWMSSSWARAVDLRIQVSEGSQRLESRRRAGRRGAAL